MKKILTLIISIIVYQLNSQEISKHSELYIKYESVSEIYTKHEHIDNDSLQLIKYEIKIPNQKKPTFILELNENHNLTHRVRGYSPFSFFKYQFFYDNRSCVKKIIKIDDYSKNYLDISKILASNLGELREIFKKIDNIYIIESHIKSDEYIAREVKFY